MNRQPLPRKPACALYGETIVLTRNEARTLFPEAFTSPHLDCVPTYAAFFTVEGVLTYRDQSVSLDDIEHAIEEGLPDPSAKIWGWYDNHTSPKGGTPKWIECTDLEDIEDVAFECRVFPPHGIGRLDDDGIDSEDKNSLVWDGSFWVQE